MARNTHRQQRTHRELEELNSVSQESKIRLLCSRKGNTLHPQSFETVSDLISFLYSADITIEHQLAIIVDAEHDMRERLDLAIEILTEKVSVSDVRDGLAMREIAGRMMKPL